MPEDLDVVQDGLDQMVKVQSAQNIQPFFIQAFLFNFPKP